MGGVRRVERQCALRAVIPLRTHDDWKRQAQSHADITAGTKLRQEGAPAGANVPRGADGAIGLTVKRVKSPGVALDGGTIADARAVVALGANNSIQLGWAKVAVGAGTRALRGTGAARAEEPVETPLRGGEVFGDPYLICDAGTAVEANGARPRGFRDDRKRARGAVQPIALEGRGVDGPRLTHRGKRPGLEIKVISC